MTDKPQYRLLQRGEPIRADDEALKEDAETWAVVGDGVFVDCPYTAHVFRPMRRRAAAALAGTAPGATGG